jgi:hypothetical protein
MSDQPVVHIGENSPEYVAWKLLHEVANAEGKVFHNNPSSNYTAADRAWILDTYAECLKAVRGLRKFQ